MVAYSQLDDNVFFKILHAPNLPDPKLAAAKEILSRIQRRKLYRLVGEAWYPKDEAQSLVTDNCYLQDFVYI
jgi:hypothetical protein